MEVKIDELITMHFWKAFAINKQIYASSGVAKRNISLGSISIVALHPLFKKWLYYLVLYNYLPISMNLAFCLLQENIREKIDSFYQPRNASFN